MAASSQIPNLLSLTLLTLLASAAAALPPTQINSNSVLVALLDSHYTELSELVEKALLLHTLEEAVSKHNISIFAPRNDALQRDLDPDFKRFLLEPRNLKSLQNLLLFHIVPARIHWRNRPVSHVTLCRDAAGEKIQLHTKNGLKIAGMATVVKYDDIIRPDGIIHGIERLLIPKTVQHAFNARRSLSATAAVLPSGAPEVDPRTKKIPAPYLPISDALAPGPSLAPAPAPGPGGPRHHFDGESQVKDFIQTLLHYGGYNEFADILVNLTSLATEMGRLVSEGYVLTVLAPGDEAMAKLTADQLSESSAPEQIIYYHLIPEYQTEESMYNAVRRFGTVNYHTLRLSQKLGARESDGSVMFGSELSSGNLVDPDIYTDGRISVQGIDGVLFPLEETKATPKASPLAKIVSKPRRGRLLEMACTMLGAVGYSNCH